MVLSLLDPLLRLALLGAIGVLAFLAIRRYPGAGFSAWIAVVCLVPYWFDIRLGIDWSISALFAVLLVTAMLPLRRPRLGLADAVVAVIVACYFAASLLGEASLASGVVLLGHWGLGYVLGRVAAGRVGVSRIHLVVAVAFSGVAVLAIIEFLTGFNLFVGLAAPGALYEAWSPLQERGGLLRVEGAFGHSIALGASLALAVPLVLAAPLRTWLRTLMLVLILTATVLTLSRTAMACAALALVFTLFFTRDLVSRRFAVMVAAAGTAAAAVLFPLVDGVFALAGDEAKGSADYRGDLLGLVGDMQILGRSPAFHRSADGTAWFGEFSSIDSALILLGLSHGLLPLALAVVLLAAGAVLVLLRRATPATIAIVAQIPAFATIALITQYAILLWFMIGLAVATQLAAKPLARAPDGGIDLRTPIHGARAAPASDSPPSSLHNTRETVPPRSPRPLPAGITKKGTSR